MKNVIALKYIFILVALLININIGLSQTTTGNSDKSIKNNSILSRPATSKDDVPIYESLRANLYLNELDTVILADGIYVQYNNSFSTGVDYFDGLKFSNLLENFGLVRNGETLILERRPVIKEKDTLFFKLWNTTERNYQFKFSTIALNHPGLSGLLEDSYLKKSTSINLNGYTNINFSVTNDEASKATNRFRIVFKSIDANLFSVMFTKVRAFQQGSSIKLEWTVTDEPNVKEYRLERSEDGVHFLNITTSFVIHNNGITSSYASTDATPLNGINYYRIMSINRSHEVKYSSLVKIIDIEKSEIRVYPNPIVNGTINLQMVNEPKGTYGMRLLNRFGQAITAIQSKHNEGSSIETLQLSKTIPKGLYQLEVTGTDKNKKVVNVIY